MPAILTPRNEAAKMASKKQPETFADKLRALRLQAGISQYRLAQISGLTKQAINVLEAGQAQPTWETVQAIAKALGVSCEAFVVEKEEE